MREPEIVKIERITASVQSHQLLLNELLLTFARVSFWYATQRIASGIPMNQVSSLIVGYADAYFEYSLAHFATNNLRI